MPRIACLVAPDLPVAALRRADPTLAGVPLVVAESPAPHARLIAASAEARARGIRPGAHGVAQARAIHARVVVRARDPSAERSAADALADVAATLAARVERAGDGAVFLDAEGAAHLVPSEAGLATALVARAARVGLEARAGVAGSMTAARLVAVHGDGCTVVPPGLDAGFLAPLPLACLAPPPALAATLARWGVARLGDLARLPTAEVGTRLGADGAALVRAARGQDARPLAPTPPAAAVEEAMALDWAVDTLEPLLFVLRALVDRALARVALGSVGCARLGVVLGLDDGGRDARTLPLAAPTRDAKTLLGCLRVDLDARPPRTGVVHVALTVVPEAVRAAQLGLFAPPGPAPERLATTLARLGVLCGDGRVGAPAVVDAHRPGAAAVAPFAPPAADVAPPQPRTAVHDAPSRADLDLSGPAAGAGRVADAGRAPAAACARLVVRAFRPPRPVEVFAERDAPAFVRGRGLGGRVVGAAGPWRIAAEWWADAPIARDYWDLELTDGGLYRCFRECASDAWFVDGIYD